MRFLAFLFSRHGVATISRMLENIGLFCKRDTQKRPVFCKETCIFKHPTHRSHPISVFQEEEISRNRNRVRENQYEENKE